MSAGDRDREKLHLTRRNLVVVGGSTIGLAAIGVSGLASKFVFPQALVALPLADTNDAVAPIPGCRAMPTVLQAEGPYYTPNLPRRGQLGQSGSGRIVHLSGRVTDTDCRPISGAVVDVWHADELGAYDNVGYGYRGHVHTDVDGRYAFSSILPGHYYFEGIWRARRSPEGARCGHGAPDKSAVFPARCGEQQT